MPQNSATTTDLLYQTTDTAVITFSIRYFAFIL